jgi:hypothetical protein
MRLTKISASITLLTLLAPIASFAAWTSPGDLARIAMPLLRQTPMDLSYELHGNMEQYYAAAWVKGQSKGFDGTTTMTIDVADGNGTLRTKLEARMKDETLYLMIKSIEGKYEHELGSLTANVTGKKWIKMPLTQSDVLSSDEEIASVLDEMFTLSESTANGVTSHQLMLKREIVKEIVGLLREKHSMLTKKLPSSALANPKASVVFTARSTANGSLLGMTTAIDVKGPDFSFIAKGSMTPSKKPFSVTIPSNVIDAEAFLDKLDSDLLSSGASSWDEDMSWMEEDQTSSQPTVEKADDCSTNISLIRKGFCNTVRTRNGR